MSLVDDLPEPVLAALHLRGQHPAYRWKLEAIIRNDANWNQWKELASWPETKTTSALNARKSLTKRYGPTPLHAGFEFATVTDNGRVWLTVKYNPELIVAGEMEKWIETKKERK